MIRVILFLISVALIAWGFAWLADRPGEVAVTWLGYRVETSFIMAMLAVIVFSIVVMVAWSIGRGVLRSPQQVSLFFRHRRAVRGYLAISRGLVAIGAGDLAGARSSAAEAARLSPGDPLALLLMAQSAQMAGDRAGAERAFRDMTARNDTRLLGLRGLYIEARRRNDLTAARLAAEEAIKVRPGVSWAGQAVLDYRCGARDWEGALDALEHMKGALEKTDYRRKRAVLLTARAQALAEIDRDTSRALILEAVKLAPDLIPAAALAGRRLAEAGEVRKARKILESAWSANPHPDIAETYAHLRLADSARERLARMRKLADKVPGQLEGALAVARAALDAREFTAAREVLAPHLSAPTRRIAVLMAEIEEAEHGDRGRVREWMARGMRASGDPAWTADGVVSDRWLPVSPNGRLDGFIWKVPLAEIGTARPVIESAPPAEKAGAGEMTEAIEDTAEPAPAPPRRKAVRAQATAKPRSVDPVVPLIHAPDDPGLDEDIDREPVPEKTTIQSTDPWQRLRRLFG